MVLQNRRAVRILLRALVLIALGPKAGAQQTQPPAPVIQAPPEAPVPAAASASSASTNRLLTGKMIYVAPMPNNLDKWLQEDLLTWGRYHVTSNPEGVDLQISAVVPDRPTRFKQRAGVPLPKAPPKKQPQETSIDVVDWVTGARLWTATLLDKNPKANAPPPPPASTIEIAARDMTPDQLALKISQELRRYVEQLEDSGGH
jgi:hypothetical protein